jgi:hypothetical protein
LYIASVCAHLNSIHLVIVDLLRTVNTVSASAVRYKVTTDISTNIARLGNKHLPSLATIFIENASID